MQRGFMEECIAKSTTQNSLNLRIRGLSTQVNRVELNTLYSLHIFRKDANVLSNCLKWFFTQKMVDIAICLLKEVLNGTFFGSNRPEVKKRRLWSKNRLDPALLFMQFGFQSCILSEQRQATCHNVTYYLGTYFCQNVM